MVNEGVIGGICRVSSAYMAKTAVTLRLRLSPSPVAVPPCFRVAAMVSVVLLGRVFIRSAISVVSNRV